MTMRETEISTNVGNHFRGNWQQQLTASAASIAVHLPTRARTTDLPLVRLPWMVYLFVLFLDMQ